MFINPGNSSKLAESIQRDYRADAEAHRQAQMGKESEPASLTLVRVGVVLVGLIALVIAIGQAMPI